jgi:hypothetical protein
MLSKSKLAGRDEQVFAAWVTMVQNKANQDSISRLKNAPKFGSSDREYALTLSFMEATLGSTDDAQPSLVQGTAGVSTESMPAAAWAIHGKICATYGYADCAKSSFDRARHTAENKPNENNVWLIAALDKQQQ